MKGDAGGLNVNKRKMNEAGELLCQGFSPLTLFLMKVQVKGHDVTISHFMIYNSSYMQKALYWRWKLESY